MKFVGEESWTVKEKMTKITIFSYIIYITSKKKEKTGIRFFRLVFGLFLVYNEKRLNKFI